MTKETIKALKMFGRTVIISVIPVLVSGLQDGIPFRETAVAIAIAFLMSVNTYVNASPDFESSGILPLVNNPK